MGYDFISEIQPKHEIFDFKAFSDVKFNLKCNFIVIRKVVYLMTDNEKIEKLRDLLEGTIDHFDLDDTMDLLYQIKDILDK